MNTDKSGAVTGGSEASRVTSTITHHTLENGCVIELPVGLPVERATNLPDSDKFFWVSTIPEEMLSNATIESHFRNIGFLIHENNTSV